MVDVKPEPKPKPTKRHRKYKQHVAADTFGKNLPEIFEKPISRNRRKVPERKSHSPDAFGMCTIFVCEVLSFKVTVFMELSQILSLAIMVHSQFELEFEHFYHCVTSILL